MGFRRGFLSAGLPGELGAEGHGDGAAHAGGLGQLDAAAGGRLLEPRAHVGEAAGAGAGRAVFAVRVARRSLPETPQVCFLRRWRRRCRRICKRWKTSRPLPCP